MPDVYNVVVEGWTVEGIRRRMGMVLLLRVERVVGGRKRAIQLYVSYIYTICLYLQDPLEGRHVVALKRLDEPPHGHHLSLLLVGARLLWIGLG